MFFENLIRHFVFITYEKKLTVNCVGVCGPYAATLCLFDHLNSVQTEKNPIMYDSVNICCYNVTVKYMNIKDTHLLQVFASFSFTFTTYCSILYTVFHWLTVINKIRETNNYAQKK